MTANRHDARGTQGVVQGDPYKEGAAPRRRPPTASQDPAGRSADDFCLGDRGLFGSGCFQGEGFEDVSVASSFNAADDVGVREVRNCGLHSLLIHSNYLPEWGILYDAAGQCVDDLFALLKVVIGHGSEKRRK